MDEETYFAVPSSSEIPHPDGAAPILLGAGGTTAEGSNTYSTNYVGDVDETPEYQAFGSAEDNAYQAFGGDAMGDDFGFATGGGGSANEDDAPILLGPPSDEDQVFFGERTATTTGEEGAAVVVEEGDDDEAAGPVVHEPSPMQKWNDEFQLIISQRREAENAKRGEQVESARQAMIEFHAARDARREARLAKNRQDEQAKLEAIEADLEQDHSWQRVCKMVELTHDSTQEAEDIKRMRDVLIHLKNDAARAVLLS